MKLATAALIITGIVFALCVAILKFGPYIVGLK